MADRFLLENGTDRLLLEDETSLLLEGLVESGAQAPFPHLSLLLQSSNSINVGVAVETDTALARTWFFTFAVATAAETDTALSLSLTRVLTPSLVAVEADVAVELAGTKFLTTGAAVETDTAFAPSFGDITQGYNPAPLPHIGMLLGIAAFDTKDAVETDTALALTLIRPLAAGLGVETDAALTPATLFKLGSIGRADETSSAEPIPFDIPQFPARMPDYGLPTAWFVDPGFAALYLTPPGGTAIANRGQATTVLTEFAVEADAALALAGTKFLTVGISTELSVGLTVALTKQRAVFQADETDTSEAVSIVRVLSVDVSAETDVAQSISLASGLTVSPGFETSAALALQVFRFIGAGVSAANEDDFALPLDLISGTGLPILPADELDESPQLSLLKFFAGSSTALESEVAIARPFDAVNINDEIAALQAALNLERLSRGGIVKRGREEDPETKMIREQNAAIWSFVGSFLNSQGGIE